MPRLHLLCGFVVFAACSLVASCAKGNKFCPVAGAVQVDGKPLTFGGVTFHPAADKGNTTPHLPMGRIDEQGRYSLFTADQQGAPPGWYRVVVLANPTLAPSMERPKFATNRKYTRVETTDVLLEVVAKPAPNAYDLQLKK